MGEADRSIPSQTAVFSFALWKRKTESPKKEFALSFLLWYNKPIMGKEVQR